MPRFDLGIPKPAEGWDYTPPSQQSVRPENLIKGIEPYVLPENEMPQSGGAWASAPPKPEHIAFKPDQGQQQPAGGSMVDDARQAGFSDAEIGQWAHEQRPNFKAAGFDDKEIDSYFSGLKDPRKVPPSFLARLRGAIGGNVSEGIVEAAGEGFQAGAGEGPSESYQKFEKEAREVGIFRRAGEPYRGLQFMNEAVLGQAAKGVDAFFRMINGAFSAAGATGGQVAANIGEATGHPIDTAANLVTGQQPVVMSPELAAHKARVAGVDLMNAYILSEMASPMSRPGHAGEVAPGVVPNDEVVGHLPTPQDFTDAAKVLSDDGTPNAAVRQKVVDLYEKEGIHPAEVAHDATVDPAVKAAVNDPDPSVVPDRYVPDGYRPEEPDVLAQLPDNKAIEARQQIYDDVRTKLIGAGLSAEEADVNASLWAARYNARAAQLGLGPEGSFELYQGEGLDVRRGVEPEATILQAAEQPARAPADLIAQREAEGQMQLPGAERIGQGELAQRRADEALRPRAEQKPLDIGLFSDDAKQRELFQSDAAAGEPLPRGRIIFDTNRALIELFAGADQSTFLHETGHLWLDELMRDAGGKAAPAPLKNDLQTVMDWLGVKDASKIGPEQHELWARGFERYMAEGKAPTPLLQRVFDSFKRWLLGIYRSLSEFEAPITDDVRSVFDRLLLTPEEAAARAAPIEEAGVEGGAVTQKEAPAATAPAKATTPEQVRKNDREALLGQISEGTPAIETIHGMFSRLPADDLLRARQLREDAGLPPITSLQEAGEAFLKDFVDYRARFNEPVDLESPEAIARQQRIVRQLLDNGGYAQGGNAQPVANDRRAVIVLGPSAGGKSTHADQLVKSRSAMLIDSDEAKKLLSTNRIDDAKNHAESSRIAEELLLPHAIEQGSNIVLPIVGKNLVKVNNIIDQLALNGYRTELHMISLPLETALQRMLLRYISRGRMIDPVYLADIDHAPDKVFDALKSRPAVSAAVRFNADVPRGSAYSVVEAVRNPDPGLGRSGNERGIERTGEAGPAPGIPQRRPEPAAAALEPIASAGIPNGIGTFAPAQLLVDAKRFQFKDATDESGVSDRLKGVTQWDPVKAGVALVWQDAQGRNYIVDGHQRLALAARLSADNPNIRLNAYTLKEGDGVSAEQARAIAAAKNIAEGTGTAVDAAKIFRDRPDLIASLPPRSELVRQARGLANLQDNAFGMVINDVVPANYAAIVGRLVPQDGTLQSALLELLAKTEPANAAQAEAIVRQGIAAGFERQVTGDMFGETEVAHSLYAERAKVLDKAQKVLRRDKAVFSVLTRDQQAIEAAGNKLAGEINAKRAAADAQALQLLQVLASRTGAISDALTDAARKAKSDGNYTSAARAFVADLRRQAESGDLARAADGTARGPAHVGDENLGLSIEAPAERSDSAAERRAAAELNATIDKARGSTAAPVSLPEEGARMFEQRGRHGPVFDFIHEADLLDLRRHKLFQYDDRGGFRKAFDNAMGKWTSTFQPQLVSDAALKADPLFARYKSRQSMRRDQAVASSEEEHQFWRNTTQLDRSAYLNAAQQGRPMRPEWQVRWQRQHAILDEAYRLEKDYGSKTAYVEEYLPQIWEDPQKAQAFFGARMRALGPTWFQKERAFQFIEEGEAAGLRLKNSNPEDLVTLRLLASADMVERMELLDRLHKDLQLATPSKDASPNLGYQGWFEITAPNREKWMISPDLEPLWRNAVEAKGLWANEGMPGSLFKGWMALKNAWVPIKLALSAFHPLHVLHINWTEGFAKAWRELTAERDPVQALKSAANGVYEPFAAAIPGVATRGKEAREAWLKREDARTPSEQAMVTTMNDGGFVPQLSEELKINGKRALENAMEKGQWIRALPAVMRRGIEAVQGPIFEKWIPSLKTSAYLGEAEALLRRRPELIDDDIQRRIALRTIAKSIDNRFGEMFYGTLFWDRYVKDAGIGSFLSLGWNLGFGREFGGSVLDPVARTVRNLTRGPATESERTIKEAQNKMTFVVSYISGAMLLNGLMTYGLSGNPPEGLDWFLPRVGRNNPDGSPHRIINMFYTREFIMAMKHIQERGGNVVTGLGEMLWNKLMFQPFKELLDNRDYYGSEVWDENAPVYKQAMQAINHVFSEQFSPMSASGANRALKTGGGWEEAGLAYLGFGPAPAYAERTATQNRIYYLYGLRHGTTQPLEVAEKKQGEGPLAYLAGRTPEEGLMDVRNEIMLARQKGDWKAAGQAEQKYLKLGGSRSSLHNIILGIGADITLFKQLPEGDQQAVLAKAPAAERAKYEPYAKTHAARDVADLTAQMGEAKTKGDTATATALEQKIKDRITEGVAKGQISDRESFQRQLSQELIDRYTPELGAILSVPKSKRGEFMKNVSPEVRGRMQ